MSHYKPYPAYRESGVEWIGQVPEHWRQSKVAWDMKMTIGWTPPTGNRSYYGGPHNWVSIADLSASRISETKQTLTDAAIAEMRGTQAPTGSLLFSYKLSIGEVALLEKPAYTNEAIAAFHPCKRVYMPFWKYAAPVILPRYSRMNIYGSDLLNQELMNSARLAIPDVCEQQEIANTLDRETARIDALITKKTRFIELLKEKRHALIDHAVTKGLNSEAPIRNSGVEWLGDIPAHWEVQRMASIFREAIRPGDQSLPILSISIHDGITDEEVAAEDRDRRVSQIEDRTKYKRVAPNDLAYNMMRAWQGAFGAVTVHGLVSPAYVVAEPMIEFRTAYIENLLRTPMAIEEMRRYSRGIADFRMRLYWDYFRDLKVCLPPLEEQDKILSMITRETSRIDLLTEKTQRSIDLLKERRAAFITAAVTGQIDLRGSA